MDWESIDWSVLERLREVFLGRADASGSYWQGETDLAHYDFTFGRRIAWKWAAVTEQLAAAGWTSPSRRLVDWGCGTAVASRSLLAHGGNDTFDEVILWDRSPSATEFARAAIQARHPRVDVRVVDPTEAGAGNSFVLVLSHVINELGPAEREALVAFARCASAVIWVEPGSHSDSRALIEARDELRKEFHCWLPCPHDGACGLHAPANARHWCHHFARPPTEAFTESGWAQFGRRLGVDLRSLPYSYLVMDRRPPPRRGGMVRIIGQPREGARVMKMLRCRAEGVAEVELQKRDAPALWKTLEKGRHAGLFDWHEDDSGRVTD